MTQVGRHDADGSAFMEFFDVRTQASFIWDGESDAVQVCIGGSGEPIDHEIPAPPGANDEGVWWANPASVLLAFEKVAKAHAETLEDYGK